MHRSPSKKYWRIHRETKRTQDKSNSCLTLRVWLQDGKRFVSSIELSAKSDRAEPLHQMLN